MKKHLTILMILGLTIAPFGRAQIKVNPSGVNVNTNGATTVFLSFGRLINQVPVEAAWCGELINAAPDIGSKCDPGTLFGRLPIRYDLSKIDANGRFTDIMSIPPSVARRAYQVAQQGAASQFFYVRRFASTIGGADEYVSVTCRLAGGGARVPFSLLDVKIVADTETPVVFVKRDATVPGMVAEIYYNGTGQLKGRWEVVFPGEEPPTAQDLLTEASLPFEARSQQRRYTELGRFNTFLPPTGSFILPGPDVRKLPTTVAGLYMVLLRIEASDDKEGDSNLAKIGAGSGIVHSGAVAGFPIPPFRYYVGNAKSEVLNAKKGKLQLLLPPQSATLSASKPVDFSWVQVSQVAIYRLEAKSSEDDLVLSALLQSGITSYRAPVWLKDKLEDGKLRWRISALNYSGKAIMTSEWRSLKIGDAGK